MSAVELSHSDEYAQGLYFGANLAMDMERDQRLKGRIAVTIFNLSEDADFTEYLEGFIDSSDDDYMDFKLPEYTQALDGFHAGAITVFNKERML